jgi:16S rRNA (adenine1518-N6/adenine1519-N6)-dimethyltransferase
VTVKSKLGQNFLADPSAALAIVDALGDISGATVVEIGPGKGAITKLLAARAERLIAVELDAELANRLQSHYAATESGYQTVQVLQQDILKTNLSAMALPGAKLVIVGNLPYYITSQILLHLFEHHEAIDKAVIMIQREVADRIAAQPGGRDYGLLTATTQLYARVESLFTLPPGAFAPPPEVHSTVLRLTFEPHFQALHVESEAFVAFLKKCFAQKRKTMANNLRFAGIPAEALQAAFRETGIQPSVRAEALPLDAAARLFLALLEISKSRTT